MRSICYALPVMAAVLCGVPVWGQPGSVQLPVEQAQLQEKFLRLETLAVRIAELVEVENPDRAEQLRGAIGRSRDLAMKDRFEAIITLLEQERYAAAQRDQDALATNLETLLELLLADPREARLEAERKRLRQAIKDVGRLIREQNALRGETLDSDQPGGLSEKQDGLAERSEGISQSLQAPGQQGPATPQAPGMPSGEEASPQQRSSQRLEQARSAMQKASGRMQQGDSRGAADAQTEAQRQLEQARQELEEALRQTREEEATRMLTRLASRLRAVLSEQTEINRLTSELQELHGEPLTPQKRSAAAGLAKRQDEAVGVVDGALRLLEEEGSSVAFIEVLEQVRLDMSDVSGRLRKSRTGEITQSIERDVVDALEDAIAALDTQLAEMAEKNSQGSPPGQQGGAAGDPPLVDQLAELRMIKSLQTRILSRTRRLHRLQDAGEVSGEELADELQELAERQRRALEAARALMGG